MGDLQPRLDLTGTDDTGLPNPPTAMLGPRRRFMAGLVTAIALLSFFVPMIRTDTPVLGRTHWSPCQVFAGYFDKTLPVFTWEDPQADHADRVMRAAFWIFGYPGEYCGVALLLLAIFLYPRAKLAGTLAVLVASDVYGSLKYYHFSSYQDGIYGRPAAFAHATAHFGANALLLLIAMGLVLLVVAWRDFEG
jgi:uncharacterized membrane protein YdcZ (DUF606 family)